MSDIRSRLQRFLPFFLLGVLGTLWCAWLMPSELRAVEEHLAGFPDSDADAHLLRPFVLTAVCFLPMLAGLCYGLGNTLDRYMTREFYSVLLLCLSALLVIWLLIDLGDNLSDFKQSPNPLWSALEFYRVRSSAILLLLLPYALLFSLIYALGKLSRDREIVAMIQSGRGLVRLTAPLMLAGFWCSLVCLGLNYQWAPTAEGSKGEILDAARGIPLTAAKHVLYHNPEHHRLWLVGGFPKDYEKGEALINVDVTTSRPDGRLESRLTAKRATWDRARSLWTFHDPVICRFTPGLPPEFETPDPPVLERTWAETPWQLIKPGLPARFLGIPDLNGWLRTHAAAYPGSAPSKQSAAYLTQWHFRWALPFSCLVTVLLAVPLSINFSRRGPGGNTLIAVGLAAGLMVLGNIVLNFGEAGLISPVLAAWLPNLVFTLVGLFLFRHRASGRPFLHFITGRFSTP